MSERVRRLQARPLQELEVSPIEPVEKAVLTKPKDRNILDRAQPSTLCYFWLTILMFCVTLSFVVAVLMVAITRIKCYRS